MARIAVVTLDGFNEVDSFVASYVLGRVQQPDWSVAIASPTPKVTSMNGVTIEAQMSLDDLPQMDAVIVGSGSRTREYAADPGFLATLRLDPQRQLVGSQCSGALLLATWYALHFWIIPEDQRFLLPTPGAILDAMRNHSGELARAACNTLSVPLMLVSI